jgi:RecA/RadA recombinase
LNSNKQAELQATIATLQKQFGDHVVTKANKSKVTAFIPTGFAELDTLLDGGIQRGRLTHLMGNPTSGMTTLALKVVSAIQQLGEGVIYLDLESSLDPNYAVAAGINPAHLLILRLSFDTVLSALFDVVSSGIPGGVVLNATPILSPAQRQKLALVLERLHPKLTTSNCALLLLTRPLTDKFLSQYASLRLMLELVDWLHIGNEVGYRGRVTALKHKGAKEGKTAHLTIMIGEQLT